MAARTVAKPPMFTSEQAQLIAATVEETFKAHFDPAFQLAIEQYMNAANFKRLLWDATLSHQYGYGPPAKTYWGKLKVWWNSRPRVWQRVK